VASLDPIRRLFRLTPDRFILLLLVVECLLWLSERIGWWHKGYAVLTGVAAVAGFLIAVLLWFTVAMIFRWRFQFSVRSLLVLAAAAAVPCSWLAVERRKASKQIAAVAEIERLDGRVTYDFELDEAGRRK
jgi:hypothetical protein